MMFVKAMVIKAFLVVYLSTGGTIELEHPSGRTAADVAECRSQSADLYEQVFGTEQRFAASFLEIRRMVAEEQGPDAANEVKILKIIGVCVDVGARGGTAQDT